MPETRPAQRILRQAGPMTIGELAGVLAPIAVVALLGRAVGTHALLVRSLYLPLELGYIAVQFAFGTSAQVGAAIAKGAGRPDRAGSRAAGLAVVWAVLGTASALLLWVASPWLATLLHATPADRAALIALVRWSAVCHPLLAVPVLCAASLRGSGHPLSGTVVSTSSAVLELATVAVFGVGAGLGANAIPLAFAVGGTVGGTLGLVLLRRNGIWPVDPRGQVSDALRRLGSVGLPVGLSYAILSVSNFVLLSLVGPLGPAVQAGYANALTLQTFVTVPGIVLGSATAILMNQQKGAGREILTAHAFRVGLGLCAVAYVPLALGLWLLRDPLAWLGTTDPAIHAQTARFLSVVGPTYLVFGLTLLSLTVIEQTGWGLLATALNLVYFAGITVVGGLTARAAHDASALYDTVAVLNVLGILAVGSAGLLVTRRSRTPARTGAPALP